MGYLRSHDSGSYEACFLELSIPQMLLTQHDPQPLTTSQLDAVVNLLDWVIWNDVLEGDKNREARPEQGHSMTRQRGPVR